MNIELPEDASCIIFIPGADGLDVQAIMPKKLADPAAIHAAALAKFMIKLLTQTDISDIVASQAGILEQHEHGGDIQDIDLSKLPVLKPTDIDCDYNCKVCPKRNRHGSPPKKY